MTYANDFNPSLQSRSEKYNTSQEIINLQNDSINNNDTIPEFIRVGSKIISIKFRDVKIICSLSFLPMPLDKFSSTFNLVENAKGFFPHLFNIRQNQNYIGPYPPKIGLSTEIHEFQKK